LYASKKRNDFLNRYHTSRPVERCQGAILKKEALGMKGVVLDRRSDLGGGAADTDNKFSKEGMQCKV
jgi:hypothetical protein